MMGFQEASGPQSFIFFPPWTTNIIADNDNHDDN